MWPFCNRSWKAWSFPLKRNPSLPPNPRKPKFLPSLEILEDRLALTGSITGSVFIDVTGNGSSSLNVPQNGVKIQVYQDTNHNGVLDSYDRLAATQTTGSNGSYAFNNLRAGTYLVVETPPSGFVRTVPTLKSYYQLTVVNGQTTTAGEFDNFQKLAHVVSNVSFTIQRGTTTLTVTDLRGNTQQGDIVTANFTVAAGATTTLSLVSYDAPGASFNANAASQQVAVDIATATYTGPGIYALTVHLPGNFYQVDFVMGSVINKFGPAGSNIFYSAQGRLLSADNQGSVAFAASTLSGSVFLNTNGVLSGQAGVLITLTGTNDLGQQVVMTTTTTASGNYTFFGLRQGTYSLTETPLSTLYANGISSIGAGDTGSGGIGSIVGIVVTNGTNGVLYNFTSRLLSFGTVAA